MQAHLMRIFGVFIAITASISAAPIATFNFEEQGGKSAAPYEIIKPSASLTGESALEGKKSLLIDTLANNSTWIPCFKTGNKIFKLNTMYDISFRCKFLDKKEGAYVLGLMRPLEAKNHLTDSGYTEVHAEPKDGIVHFYVTLPMKGPDYAFQLHTFKKVKVIIDDIQIKELKRDFIAINPSVKPVEKLPPAPTGSADFTVELPRLEKAKEFFGKDFGITPENPDNSTALQDAISKIRKQVPARLILEPGDYYFKSDIEIKLFSIRDFELDGKNAKFIFHKNKGKIFRVENCNRVALRNFSIDWDWDKDPLASAVKVEKIDDQGGWIDLRFVDYKQFPKQNLRIVSLGKIDPKTRFCVDRDKLNISFEFYKGQGDIPKTEWIEKNLLRLYASANKLNQIQVNDWFLVKHYYYDMTGINMISNDHLTIDNVHILSCPGMGMLTSGVQKYWQVLNSSIAPPKKTNRVLSSTADQIHFSSSCGFFRLENTDLEKGGDDSLNIHDLNAFALREDDKRVMIQNANYHPGNYYQKNDLIELLNDDFSPTGFKAKAKTVTRIKNKHGKIEIVFDEKIPPQPGTGFIVINRRFGTSNVIIKNNRFHNFTRGILLMASNVTIEGNDFDQGIAGAIKIETGYTMKNWSEGYGASNILIKNNRFNQVNRSGRYAYENHPDIYISTYMVTDPCMIKIDYPVFNDILIQNNKFIGSNGAPVFAASAKNLVIDDNTFDLRQPETISTQVRGALTFNNCSNIYISNNKWLTDDSPVKPGILIDSESVKNISLTNNKIIK